MPHDPHFATVSKPLARLILPRQAREVGLSRLLPCLNRWLLPFEQLLSRLEVFVVWAGTFSPPKRGVDVTIKG